MITFYLQSAMLEKLIRRSEISTCFLKPHALNLYHTFPTSINMQTLPHFHPPIVLNMLLTKIFTRFPHIGRPIFTPNARVNSLVDLVKCRKAFFESASIHDFNVTPLYQSPDINARALMR